LIWSRRRLSGSTRASSNNPVGAAPSSFRCPTALYTALLSSGRCRPWRKGAGYSTVVVERGRALRAAGLTLAATAGCRVRRCQWSAHQQGHHRRAAQPRRRWIEGRRGCRRAGPANYQPQLHDPPPRLQGHPSAGVGSCGIPLTLRTAEDRCHALWVLLATTGTRRGEALALRWSDSDLDAGRARIVQTIVKTRNVVSVGEPIQRADGGDLTRPRFVRHNRRQMGDKSQERSLTGGGDGAGC
jgi:hypothetical protein